MTLSTQLVLRALLEHEGEELYGLQIAGLAGLATGTVHPILARLERLGWVASRWEDIDSRREGRPARRYYGLSGSGADNARSALARAHRPSRLTSLHLEPLGEA